MLMLRNAKICVAVVVAGSATAKILDGLTSKAQTAVTLTAKSARACVAGLPRLLAAEPALSMTGSADAGLASVADLKDRRRR